MSVVVRTFSVTAVGQTVDLRPLTKIYSHLSPDSTCETNTVHNFLSSPSKWPRGSTAAHFLGLRVRIARRECLL
jgi:hypothetical protein